MGAILPLALPTYLIRFRVLGLPSTVLEAYILVLLVSFTLAFGLNGWRRAASRLEKWRWPILAWTLITFASALWSPDMFNGLGLWRAYVLEPVFIFILMHELLDEERGREWLRRSLVAITSFVVLWGVIQFVTGSGIPSPWNVAIGEGRRATGPFPYPNALALFVVPIGAWAFARWLNRKREWWLLLASCFALVGTLVAKSDGGLLALVAAIGVAMLVYSRRTRTIALSAAAIGILIVLLVPTIREPILEEAQFKSWSGRVRTWMWTETWNMLKDTSTPVGLGRPILGAGFGGYPTVFAPYHEKTFIEIFQYPHTIVLNFWSETGLPGLLVFGWIFCAWYRSSSLSLRGVKDERRSNLAGEALPPLTAIFVHGLVDVPYFKNDLAIVFWLIIFMTTYKRVGSK